MTKIVRMINFQKSAVQKITVVSKRVRFKVNVTYNSCSAQIRALNENLLTNCGRTNFRKVQIEEELL